MKPRLFLLSLSNFAVQAWRDPLAFVAKVMVRLGYRPFGENIAFTALGGQKKSDFNTKIVPSGTGQWNGRVLHVLTNSLPHSTGGYAVRTHEILKAQLKIGIVASAITRLAYPVDIGRLPNSDREEIDGVKYARALPGIFPASFSQQTNKHAALITAEALQSNASILHTTTPWPNAAATSLAARKLGIPWIYEVRGEPESTWAAAQSNEQVALVSNHFRRSRAKETEAMCAAAGVIALSEVSSEEIRKRGVRTPIWVVPNSVDSDWAALKVPKYEARKTLGLTQCRYVGAVSSIVEYEGFDTLVLALHHLPPDVKVLLVGDGSELSALQALAKEEGLLDRVEFAGRQKAEDIHLWYSALDVFAVPRKDSRLTRTVTPIKTLQARSFGIPIVATDSPALREAAGAQATFIRSVNPKRLAKALLNALDNGVNEEPSPQVPTWAQAAKHYETIYEGFSQ